jgi:hypothetical protein
LTKETHLPKNRHVPLWLVKEFAKIRNSGFGVFEIMWWAALIFCF